MNIVIIGAGYVGLVTGACLAEIGNTVTCYDIDNRKIANLNKGIVPIYEPGLDDLIESNVSNQRLSFSNSLESSIDDSHPEIIFIAVGTPSDDEGFAEIKYVLDAARSIGRLIKYDCTIVDKSTVPVGVADTVKKIIQDKLDARSINLEFDVVSNPEFLREGAAIKDFMSPDRVIIGVSDLKSKEVMLKLYSKIESEIFCMAVKDAEMTKYAANAMLATKISFINEIALISEKLGVDIENVKRGIAADYRIGKHFINPGCGYGGSCFPKDVKALIKIAEDNAVDPKVLHSVEDRNNLQKHVLPNKVVDLLGGDLTDSTIAVWGLAFKPETDDLREASSLVLLEQLLSRNALVRAYDPVASEAAKGFFPEKWFKTNRLHFMDNKYTALEQSDVLVLVTEWGEFAKPDFKQMHQLMRKPYIIDGRNHFDSKAAKDAGFGYYGIGIT